MNRQKTSCARNVDSRSPDRWPRHTFRSPKKAGRVTIISTAAVALAALLTEPPPIQAAQPSADASAELSVSVLTDAGQGWDVVAVEGPEYETEMLSVLYGCVTVSDWCPYCSCDSGQFEVAECRITTCRVPSPELGQLWDETVEYSAGCAYCTVEGGPGACPLEDCLPDLGWFLDREPLIYDQGGDSELEEQGDGVRVWFMQHLALEDDLQTYGVVGSAGFECDIGNGLIFTRPEGVSPSEPTTLELNLSELAMLLETGSGEETIGFSDAALLVTSPQFGLLFRCSVHQPKWGMAQIIGHVPPEAFELWPGGASLTGYQHPPIVIQVPPGMMEVVVEFQYLSSGAGDFDRNGNGNPDQLDISQGLSADENHDLIPDEVEPFGLLHTALRQALLLAGEAGELVVSNIGPSGQDGVRADLGEAAAYRAELAPLPPIESLPVGGRYLSAAGGSYAGQPGTPLGRIRTAKTEPGEQVALFADFSSIGADTVDIMIGGEETALYEYPDYELDWETPFALASNWPSAVNWLIGPQDPVASDGFGVVLEYEGLGTYELPDGILEEINNGVLIVWIDNSIFMPKPDYIGRVRHRAAEVETFALISETVEPSAALGDLNCDGAVDFFDIEAIVMALTDPEGYAGAYPDCDIMLADANGDGSVDFFDIEPLVDLLIGGE